VKNLDKKIKIPGINGGVEFTMPELCPADEEARLKAVIDTKKEYADSLDIPEVEDLARERGAYAMLESVLKRVDKEVTADMLMKLPAKYQNMLAEALFGDMLAKADGGETDPFQEASGSKQKEITGK